MKLTRHATIRCRQRGYKADDLALIERYGTATGDGIFLRHHDVELAIRDRKREIAALERLDGTMVVVADASIVTVQRARRWKERAALRRPQAAGPRPSSKFTSTSKETPLR